MGKKIMLMLAAGLAAFVLVLASGTATYVLINGRNRDTTQPAIQQVDTSAGQVTDSSGSTENSPALSADDAVQVVLSFAPGVQVLSSPTLVTRNGSPAYEVPTDRGTALVDANTGEVLNSRRGQSVPGRGRGQNREEPDDDDDGADY